MIRITCSAGPASTRQRPSSPTRGSRRGRPGRRGRRVSRTSSSVGRLPRSPMARRPLWVRVPHSRQAAIPPANASATGEWRLRRRLLPARSSRRRRSGVLLPGKPPWSITWMTATARHRRAAAVRAAREADSGVRRRGWAMLIFPEEGVELGGGIRSANGLRAGSRRWAGSSAGSCPIRVRCSSQARSTAVAPPRGSSPCVFVQVRWRPYPLSLTSSLTGGDDLRITSPQRPTGCCGPGPRRAAVDARRCSPAWLLDWLLVRSSPVIASSQFARRVYLGRGRGSIEGSLCCRGAAWGVDQHGQRCRLRLFPVPTGPWPPA
jgi:hypothetical protein